MRSHALRADLLMLLTAMIWGSAFVAQRLGMDAVGPFLYSGLRFALAALVLLPLLPVLQRLSRSAPLPPVNRQLLLGGGLMGLALALGINLQQVGLLFTSVTNSGFITGLYVIIVPLLGLLIGHKTGLGIWLGACLAVVGMFLLSVGEGFQVASGDWLQLAGACVWGVHVLLVGFFAGRHDPLRLAVVQFVTCALISLLLAVLFEEIHLDGIIAAGPAILYGGLFGVAIGFTLQVVAQKHAIASHAAIILSLEAVFAAIAGALMLGESLELRGYFGCALMFGGMLLAQLWPRKSPPLTETPASADAVGHRHQSRAAS
ncbi:DMT family transporter [Pseudomonas benzenivorans]|uniref:DMT family transporter n=1 Tax=Pseudomonas benzenivorans TaxID=556533 RepID=A0ABZ0PS78_9PSED|nr:DMT family transporter [Pseudomonas benzenivorans]WPC04013.1 DMT family transporter [Pseudomonas benzenivorans]